MLSYLVVLIEAMAALGATLLIRRWRRFGALGRILCGVLLGMTYVAFLHGFGFGVLNVEGHRGPDDPLLLAGFGVVGAFLLGLPLGAIVGLVLWRMGPSSQAAESAAEDRGANLRA